MNSEPTVKKKIVKSEVKCMITTKIKVEMFDALSNLLNFAYVIFVATM